MLHREKMIRGDGTVGARGREQVLGKVPSKQHRLCKAHSNAEGFGSGGNTCSILISFPVTITEVLIGTNVIIIIIIEMILLLSLLLAIIYKAIMTCQTLRCKPFYKYDFIYSASISRCLLFLCIWHFGTILFGPWQRPHNHILRIPHGALHTPGPQAQLTQSRGTQNIFADDWKIQFHRQPVWAPKLRMEKSNGRDLCAQYQEAVGRRATCPQQRNKSRSITDHPFFALPLFACCHFLFFSSFFPSHPFQRFTFQGCCLNCFRAVCALS